MTRELFNLIIHEQLKDYEIYNLLDIIEQSKNSDGFIIQYLNETVLIYNTYTDKYCSWYKLTHLGRALMTNIESRQELEDFLVDLKGEIWVEE